MYVHASSCSVVKAVRTLRVYLLETDTIYRRRFTGPTCLSLKDSICRMCTWRNAHLPVLEYTVGLWLRMF